MKHVIIGTAGHIDHGKTSLIKLLTGIDCDTHKEEKERGITINLGFSHIELPSGESCGIIDVPGHKDFITTMVGGACGIDLVLLVIAADSGMMPQTIEHLNIITALGIKNGVVALTKIDLVDEELAEMAMLEISEYLEKTSLKNIPVVGVSAHTGKGKDELIAALENAILLLDEKEKGNLFRIYIDRIFSVKGMGSVVTGSVLSGGISLGNDVYLLPGDKQKNRIRSIERHGKPVDAVVRGDRAAINLIGLKNEDFKRGMLLCEKQLETTILADAFISLFNNAPALELWSNIIIISGTFECQARMHLLNKEVVQPAEDALVQLHLSQPAILLNRDKFILRNTSGDITLGGGYIIDAAPLHHRKRTEKLIETLANLSVNILSDNNINENINLLLNREFRPFFIDELAEKLSLKKDELKTNIQNNSCQFFHYENNDNDILIATKFDEAFTIKILKILQLHHKQNAIFAEGLESGEIISKLDLSKVKSGKMYLELLLQKMYANKQIDKCKKTWIKWGHTPQIDSKFENEIQWIENEILNYKEGKPIQSEIEKKAS